MIELTRFKDIEDIKNSLLKTEPYIRAIIKIILKFDEMFLEYKKKMNLYTVRQEFRLMTFHKMRKNCGK